MKAGQEIDILSRQEGKVRLFAFGELVFARTKLKTEEYFEALGNDSYQNDSLFVYENNEVAKDSRAIFLNFAIGPGFEVPITQKISINARGGIIHGFMLTRFSSKSVYIPMDTGIGGHIFYSFSINYEL